MGFIQDKPLDMFQEVAFCILGITESQKSTGQLYGMGTRCRLVKDARLV